MNIRRNTSHELRKRICAAGENTPIVVRWDASTHTTVLRVDGSELSEPERIRVLGLLAADDAEPFAETDRVG